MSDWRADNARNLSGLAFRWQAYRAPRPDWDHDHCEGCMAKFAEIDGEDVLREGYASDARFKDRPGYYDWICADCFRDLKEELNWTQVGFS